MRTARDGIDLRQLTQAIEDAFDRARWNGIHFEILKALILADRTRQAAWRAVIEPDESDRIEPEIAAREQNEASGEQAGAHEQNDRERQFGGHEHARRSNRPKRERIGIRPRHRQTTRAQRRQEREREHADHSEADRRRHDAKVEDKIRHVRKP